MCLMILILFTAISSTLISYNTFHKFIDFDAILSDFINVNRLNTFHEFIDFDIIFCDLSDSLFVLGQQLVVHPSFLFGVRLEIVHLVLKFSPENVLRIILCFRFEIVYLILKFSPENVLRSFLQLLFKDENDWKISISSWFCSFRLKTF